MASNLPSGGIDYFNRGHWLTPIQERVSRRARRKMFDRWRRFAAESGLPQTFLDIGATPDAERLDSNCMIPWLLEGGFQVSLYSPEDISRLRSLFPGAVILPPSGAAGFPAQDRQFAWVGSSAVLEHVGARESQLAFIRETARAGDGIFLTTPNRWHWLEFHTKLPFLHWLPKRLHRALLQRLGKHFWAREQNLNLVGRRELLAMAREALGDRFDFRIEAIWTLGAPSNLMLLARRR